MICKAKLLTKFEAILYTKKSLGTSNATFYRAKEPMHGAYSNNLSPSTPFNFSSHSFVLKVGDKIGDKIIGQ